MSWENHVTRTYEFILWVTSNGQDIFNCKSEDSISYELNIIKKTDNFVFSENYTTKILYVFFLSKPSFRPDGYLITIFQMLRKLYHIIE